MIELKYLKFDKSFDTSSLETLLNKEIQKEAEMSVPRYRRTESILKVLLESQKFFINVSKNVRNEKFLSKKKFHTFGYSLLENTRQLLYNINHANWVMLNDTTLSERTNYQTEAIKLAENIELDVELILFESESTSNNNPSQTIVEKCSTMIKDIRLIRDLLYKWRKSDIERITKKK